MKFGSLGLQWSLAVLLLTGMVLGSDGASAEEKEKQRKAKATDLAWMAGCWQSLAGEPGSGEHWSPPAGGTLIGSGRTIKDSKTVAHEFLVIKETDDGGLVYVAAPAAQTGTVFFLSLLREKEVIFENPQHDFPQRIMYRLHESGKLLARIEGIIEGKPKGLDFPMTPVACR